MKVLIWFWLILLALRFHATPALKVEPPAWLIALRWTEREWRRWVQIGGMVYGLKVQVVAVPAEAVRRVRS